MKVAGGWGLVCNSNATLNLGGKEVAGPDEAAAICDRLGFALPPPSYFK